MYPISVVISTYNDEGYIAECLNSVVAAGASEIILVNDGCIDNTIIVAEELDIPHLKVITLESNSGPSRARNVGLNACSQPYAAIVDGDDVIPIDRLKSLVTLLEETNVLGVVDELVAFDSETSELLWKKIQHKTPFFKNKILTISDLLRFDLGSLKPAFNLNYLRASGVAYPVASRRGEDFLLLLELLHKKHRLLLSLDSHYLLRRETVGRLTSSRSALYKELVRNELYFYLRHSWELKEHILFLRRHARNFMGYLRNRALGR